jgi:hypothetical protein
MDKITELFTSIHHSRYYEIGIIVVMVVSLILAIRYHKHRTIGDNQKILK